jgi:hypothetical protein
MLMIAVFVGLAHFVFTPLERSQLAFVVSALAAEKTELACPFAAPEAISMAQATLRSSRAWLRPQERPYRECRQARSVLHRRLATTPAVASVAGAMLASRMKPSNPALHKGETSPPLGRVRFVSPHSAHLALRLLTRRFHRACPLLAGRAVHARAGTPFTWSVAPLLSTVPRACTLSRAGILASALGTDATGSHVDMWISNKPPLAYNLQERETVTACGQQEM